MGDLNRIFKIRWPYKALQTRSVLYCINWGGRYFLHAVRHPQILPVADEERRVRFQLSNCIIELQSVATVVATVVAVQMGLGRSDDDDAAMQMVYL